MRKKEEGVIFLWLPKTAGSSIYEILRQHGCPKLKKYYLYKSFSNKGIVTFSHVDIFYLLRKGIVRREFFDNSFKFCFVRNPWDRLVSIYKYKGYDKKMSFDKFVYLIKKRIELQNSFPGKIMRLIHYSPRIICHGLEYIAEWLGICLPLPEINHYNEAGLSQANPQTNWIKSKEGKIIADFVGRFENLDDDLVKCFGIIGITDYKLPHLNKSNHKYYRKYYNDETRKIVGEIYRDDIKSFGYNF